MSGKRKKAAAGEKGPRVYQMGYGLGRWYWRNKEGRWVDVTLIPDHGVMRILGVLDERGPQKYCDVMEEEARRRGLIDDDGRRRVPAGEPMEATTA